MKLSITVGPMLMALLLVATPAAANRQPAAQDCESWNTEEFFETVTPETVAACLAAGADVAFRTDDGHTPLHMAANVNEDPAVVRALLEAGADMEAQAADDGHTPVHEAAGNPNPAVLEVLFAAGADPDVRAGNGASLLHFATPAVARALIVNGSDLEVKDDRGFTPLHRAVLRGNTGSLEVLIDAGADVEAPGKGGVVPVQNAAWAQNPAVFDALISAGADPEVRTEDGRTLLHLAAQNNGNAATIRALLDVGALARMFHHVLQSAQFGTATELVWRRVDRFVGFAVSAVRFGAISPVDGPVGPASSAVGRRGQIHLDD